MRPRLPATLTSSSGQLLAIYQGETRKGSSLSPTVHNQATTHFTLAGNSTGTARRRGVEQHQTDSAQAATLADPCVEYAASSAMASPLAHRGRIHDTVGAPALAGTSPE